MAIIGGKLDLEKGATMARFHVRVNSARVPVLPITQQQLLFMRDQTLSATLLFAVLLFRFCFDLFLIHIMHVCVVTG